MPTSPSRIKRPFLGRREFLQRSWSAAGAAWLLAHLPRTAAAETQIAARIAEAPEAHTLVPALKQAAKALEAVEQAADYSALLVRQELVDRKLVSSKLELKLRHKPFSVYLKFLEPNAGREVVFVEGRNNDQLQVHETGLRALVGTLSLDPQGSLAMDGNRYPVTMIGMQRMVSTILEQWLKLTSLDDVKVTFYPNAKIGALACQTIECALPKAVEGIPYELIRLYIDSDSGLPIRCQSYGPKTAKAGKPPVIEDYFYQNVKTNIGLKDIDFDVANPAYAF